VSRFLTPAVRALMDDAHVEGRRGIDIDDKGPPGAAADGAGLAEVDRMLAGLWA